MDNELKRAKIPTRKLITIGVAALGLGIILSSLIALFWINGVRSVKDIFTSKTALENAYYLMQIICSFVVMVGGIIGVWQYVLAKQAEKNHYHNDRIQKAIDLSEYYKDNILCYIVFIHCVYEESGILDVLNEVKRSDMRNFDVLELNRNFTKAQNDKISEIVKSPQFLKIIIENASIFSKEPLLDKLPIKDKNNENETVALIHNKVMNYFRNDIICETLNNLEYFSLHFNYGLADKITVYQSLHQTYLKMVQMLYYDISINNAPGKQKLYTNVIELFNDWKMMAEKQNLDEVKFSKQNLVKGSKAKTIE